MIPGEYRLKSEPVIANENRRVIQLDVANAGDRPIQVGSHFHFFEANRALRFDRAQAFGMRLNIPAGTAVRFEAGDAKRVELTEIAGAKDVHGLNGLTNGARDGSGQTGRAEAQPGKKAFQPSKLRSPNRREPHAN